MRTKNIDLLKEISWKPRNDSPRYWKLLLYLGPEPKMTLYYLR